MLSPSSRMIIINLCLLTQPNHCIYINIYESRNCGILLWFDSSSYSTWFVQLLLPGVSANNELLAGTGFGFASKNNDSKIIRILQIWDFTDSYRWTVNTK
ncbi:hypothetical protein OIU74_016168 [Salix koriyanagi]|uniref:Uncharacterized protein n=1 Tax=Salix koriyanagi TaxID=2511006 RepID=A0A9Q0PG33_9ROSI|nr:hypothetical protein OIU74_016168 [Salix koriyanagi]